MPRRTFQKVKGVFPIIELGGDTADKKKGELKWSSASSMKYSDYLRLRIYRPPQMKNGSSLVCRDEHLDDLHFGKDLHGRVDKLLAANRTYQQWLSALEEPNHDEFSAKSCAFNLLHLNYCQIVDPELKLCEGNDNVITRTLRPTTSPTVRKSPGGLKSLSPARLLPKTFHGSLGYSQLKPSDGDGRVDDWEWPSSNSSVDSLFEDLTINKDCEVMPVFTHFASALGKVVTYCCGDAKSATPQWTVAQYQFKLLHDDVEYSAKMDGYLMNRGEEPLMRACLSIKPRKRDEQILYEEGAQIAAWVQASGPRVHDVYDKRIILISQDREEFFISVPEYVGEYWDWLQGRVKKTDQFMTIHTWGPLNIRCVSDVDTLMRVLMCITITARESSSKGDFGLKRESGSKWDWKKDSKGDSKGDANGDTR